MYPVKKKHNPLNLLIVTSASIFVAEALVMLLLSQLQILSAPLEMVIDSILLTIFIVPVLYLFLFRPMITNINDRLRAEDDLKKAKSGLEVKIQERTEELNKSNEQLKLEIIERREIEKETVAAKVRL